MVPVVCLVIGDWKIFWWICCREENSGAGGLGIFIAHSLGAQGIEAQYQRNNQVQFIFG